MSYDLAFDPNDVGPDNGRVLDLAGSASGDPTFPPQPGDWPTVDDDKRSATSTSSPTKAIGCGCSWQHGCCSSRGHQTPSSSRIRTVDDGSNETEDSAHSRSQADKECSAGSISTVGGGDGDDSDQDGAPDLAKD